MRSTEKYAVSYCQTFDEVAKEGKFLSISGGYPIEDILRFIKVCRQSGYPQFLLVEPGGRAVGWCDIVRRCDEPDDVGFLGVGIAKKYRGMGWGSRLMTATVNDAKKRGFNEIRLEVRASNYNAIRAYTRLGFVKIAYITDGVVTDGAAEDVWLMSLYCRDIRPEGFEREKFFALFPKTGFRFRKG
ncbi:MAG: GNAT family N-acetyltransferase [Clostridia bacterium]|nr:GNAT family N-acetyltransferase [Clostridia bacterium]